LSMLPWPTKMGSSALAAGTCAFYNQHGQHKNHSAHRQALSSSTRCSQPGDRHSTSSGKEAEVATVHLTAPITELQRGA
jgi:hypothetical protein